jgi:hypothetical protein
MLRRHEAANRRHRAAIFSPSNSPAMNFSRSSIWLHSCQGILLSSQKAQLCNPCLRNELSPFSQEGQICQTRFSLVSSSITVTVAPNLTVSPESFDTPITSARTSLVLKFRDASLVDFLLGFGGLILRILGQVGVIREGVLDAFADARAIGSSVS